MQFYAAARLSQEAAAKVYDLESQKQMQNRFAAPGRKGYWPYLHAPFFTVVLIPLAWFSYGNAFWLWSTLTVTLASPRFELRSGFEDSDFCTAERLFKTQ